MAREFESKTYDNIFNDLKDSLEDKQVDLPDSKKFTDFAEGSIISTILRSLAGTMSGYWDYFKELTDSFYISSAEGEKLSRRLEDFNYKVKIGTPSKGTVWVIKPDGVATTVQTIPVGTELICTNPAATLVVKSVTGVFSSSTVKQAIQLSVETKDPGNINIPAGRSVSSTTYNAFTFKVGETTDSSYTTFSGAGISGGSSSETDEQAREGFRAYIQNIGYGTVSIIENTVKSLPGVLNAKVYDNSALLQGNITSQQGSIVVEVVPETFENGEMSLILQNLVRTQVNAKKAAGIRFDLKTPSVLKLSCTVILKTTKVETSKEVLEHVEVVRNKLIAYFSSLSTGSSIYVGALESLLFNSSVTDIGVKVELRYTAEYPVVSQRGQLAETGVNRVVSAPTNVLIVLKEDPEITVQRIQ